MSTRRCLRLEAGRRCSRPAECGQLVCALHAATAASPDPVRDADLEVRALFDMIARSIPVGLAAWPPARAMTAAELDALFDGVSRWRRGPRRRPLWRAVVHELAAVWAAWRQAARAWKAAGQPDVRFSDVGR